MREMRASEAQIPDEPCTLVSPTQGIPLSKNSSQNRFFQLYFFRKSCKCLVLTIFLMLLPRFGYFCSGAYRGIIIITSCLKVDVLYSKTLLKTMSKALQSAPGSTPPRARDILYIGLQAFDIKVDENDVWKWCFLTSMKNHVFDVFWFPPSFPGLSRSTPPRARDILYIGLRFRI